MVKSGRVSDVRQVDPLLRISGVWTVLKRFCGRESGSVGNAVAWCVVILLLAVTGCGGDSVPEEYSGPPSVSGTVTLDGAPLVAATVSFETSESGPFPAVTNGLGQYVFENEETTPPLGKYLVRITRSADSEAASSGSELQALPARYNSKTELIVDVLAGQNPIDFRLTSVSEDDGIDE